MYNAEYDIKNEKYNKIHEYINNSEYEKAIDSILEFMDEYPSDEFIKFDYGRCLIKINKISDGIEILEQLRKKNPKKINFRIYAVLIDTYMKLKNNEKIDKLLYDASKIFDEYDFISLKIKYYQNLGLVEYAEKLIDKAKPRNEKEESKLSAMKYLTADNEYLRNNKKQIEKNMKKYIKKKYITRGAARKIYLKLYIACSNFEEAYNYMANSEEDGPEALLLSYEICKRLNKNYEAEKYFNIINKISKTQNLDDLSLTKAKILFINNKKDEAYELCKKIAPNDLEAAIELCKFSIILGKTEEIIDIIKSIIDSNSLDNRKNLNLIERLCGIYIYNKRYEEAINLYRKNANYIRKDIGEEIGVFLSKKFGLDLDLNNKRYIIKQIIKYDYNLAIEHISKHKYENNSKVVHTVFNEKMSIEDLIEKIKPHLVFENLIEVGVINRYEIDCTNLEINEERISVGTLSGTNQIIFCYPSKQLYDELEEVSENKVLVRKTGLQKFNEKYKNFFKTGK